MGLGALIGGRRGRTRAIARWSVLAALVTGVPVMAQGGVGAGMPDRIWSVRDARPVSREELLAHLAQADLILLGETHDNVHHHRVQLGLMDALERSGRPPIVAMEQFDRERQADLDRARGARSSVPVLDARAVATAAGFDFEGWSWALYGPIIERSLARGWPLVAINLSRREAARVVREGLGALTPGEVMRLGLNDPLPADQLRAMRDDIETGHCGMLPPRWVEPMVDAQRARDAVMAERLLSILASAAQPGSSASAPVGVAILGRGHARLDRGAGFNLVAHAPQRVVISIGLVESDSPLSGTGAPERASGSGGERRPIGEFPSIAAHNDASADSLPRSAFDYLWFTPGIERADPCLALVQDRKPPARP